DSLPSSLTVWSAASTRGSCDSAGGVLQCSLGPLGAGEQTVVTLLAQTTASGTFTNRAIVSGSVGDFNLADNAVTNVISVLVATDLALAINSRPAVLWLGDDLLYALTVTNRGLTAAASVQLTNPMPPGVTFVSASPSQGGCTRQGSELFCDLGSLSPGAGASVALLVHPTLPGPLTNTAIVGCELFDLNLTN